MKLVKNIWMHFGGRVKKFLGWLTWPGAAVKQPRAVAEVAGVCQVHQKFVMSSISCISYLFLSLSLRLRLSYLENHCSAPAAATVVGGRPGLHLS